MPTGGPGSPSRAARPCAAAEVLLGGPRQLDLVAGHTEADVRPWPSPLLPALPGLFAELRGPAGVRAGQRRPDVPRHRRHAGPAARRRTGCTSLPHPSSVSLACARLGWPLDGRRGGQRGRPAARPGAPRARTGRADAGAERGRRRPRPRSPRLLVDAGLRRVGADRARAARRAGRAARCRAPPQDWVHPPGDPLNVVAVACAADPGRRSAPRCRACPTTPTTTTASSPSARSAPSPSRCSGRGPASCCGTSARARAASRSSGCVPTATCRAVAVESAEPRAARIAANAAALGVPCAARSCGAGPRTRWPGCRRRTRSSSAAASTADGVLDACWAALRPGGRLVANAVTLESEAVLGAGYAPARRGADAARGAAGPRRVGGFTGWRPVMPVTIWSVAKP